MVKALRSTSIEYTENPGLNSTQISSVPAATSSVVAYYSDPDLLIREYFLSSLEQRARSRKNIVKHIETLSVFAILSWGASGKARESRDGAVNLLAEISSLQLLSDACEAVQMLYSQMAESPSTRLFVENFIEILIKAVACAYQIDADQRFRLLTQNFHSIDNRMIKSSLIDALMIISDEVDLSKIREELLIYVEDSDQYVHDYAMEALQDID